jgi:hypothetical protein
MYNRLQSCINQDASCLDEWDYDYVYIRKVRPMREGNVENRPSILAVSLRDSQHHQIVFENDEAVIFRSAR